MSKLEIFYFIILFKCSLTLFFWDIHQFVFLTWIHVRNLSFSVQALIIDYMIIFNSFTWNENFSSVCSNRGEISARFTVMKFLHIIVILFLHRCRLTWEMKSHHGLTSRNFNPGWNFPPCNPPLRWICENNL